MNALISPNGLTRLKDDSAKAHNGFELVVTVEDPDAEDEPRFVTVGLGNGGELLVAVWTERDDKCRLISVRRPTRKERKHYES